MNPTIKSLSTNLTQKDKPKIPKGATIIDHSCSVEVEEIENGYLVIKRGEIKYSIGSGNNQRTDWSYYTLKVFTKTNPITVKDKALADLFEDSEYEQ